VYGWQGERRRQRRSQSYRPQFLPSVLADVTVIERQKAEMVMPANNVQAVVTLNRSIRHGKMVCASRFAKDAVPLVPAWLQRFIAYSNWILELSAVLLPGSTAITAE